MSVEEQPTGRMTLSGLPAPAPARLRWLWYVPGVLAVLWGLNGLLTASHGPAPISFGVFVLAGVLVHDAILVPAVIALGWLVARVAPPMLRAPIQVGLFATGALTLADIPNVLGFGYNASVPSALPFDYGARLLVMLGVLWLGIVVWIGTRILRQRAAGAQAPAPAGGS